ncbi:peptide/nickel transport system permease protein [Pontibacter aydingkolensis]|uniref:ABC transporter permease n=1 Tax=Pontibacter aydingkolensis TaxID=1911536 RepID=A0ABS7CW39_9BACT|nr:ABC transporter permease [Pontibacter aydingkolensis]MBW7467983.1 ABC transporter permease [Pontibacter aydingkolensis]
MIQLLTGFKQLWHEKLAFKIAASYMLLLLALVLALPVLPIAYSPNELDLHYTFARPLTKGSDAWHWLGTDVLGRDVWANILYGARSAMMISFPVMLFSTVLGLVAGTSAGFFGNNSLKVSRAAALVSVLSLSAIFYYALYLPLSLHSTDLPLKYTWLSLLFLLLILLVLHKALLPLLKKWRFAEVQLSLPLDYLVLRLTEAFTSIPRLLLILALASFLQPSVVLLSIIFAATFWTSTARLARAEMLKIKQLPYFEAAQSIGVPRMQLLARHALPNMLGPVVVTFTFGLAGLLALESTLSFLGIGVPGTFVSWGRTIAGIRSNTSAWWLVVFPGIALAATVWALQTISYHLLNYFGERK